MENNILQQQVGGTYYKDLPMQPIILIAKANCNFFQGCIIKYISRHKYKNKDEDVRKSIHYAELASELLPLKNSSFCNIGLGYGYAKANNFNSLHTEIIIATLLEDYSVVLIKCKELLKKEYSSK